ncbi:MAG: hypothetical protein DWQ18_06670 [Crenarchaeota archaeon]|nr:MAG: hypothetical protein DWQ17_03115 [Thermoproteota archaeon]RDJ32868.1 MAG: hypothetical protein DWQ18_06670 [Thermoproteota archaeon]RDJ38037.1 MAG: hypothetical protein DWQ13_05300 [Thermoproteota archaeon]RDJ38298.1 MAG: hypothetical protein DWQ19_00505 [Thermoproteota archaeon]
MAAIDKAAIAWTIAIVAFGAGIAAVGDDLQSTAVVAPAAKVTAPMEKTTQTDPFADIAEKVKEKAAEPKMEETPKAMDEKPKVEEKPKAMEEKPKAMGPKTVNVSMPQGSGIPGCEETNECYIPASVSINVGDTVHWTNDDAAAHTVTSGSPSAGGPDGKFDSSLMSPGATFDVTFDEKGSVDYFCIVHPWMVGNVNVN